MIHVCYEVISEDLRATLNAFLYRTGEQSNKYVTYVLLYCYSSTVQFECDAKCFSVIEHVEELSRREICISHVNLY